jgi:hypothetical protein
VITPEVRRFMKEEISRQVNVILSGAAGDTTVSTETIDGLFPGMPGILNRPVMHPYGFVSRVPRGTISVTARQGENAGNRLVLGHRDANRPNVEVGECQLYNQFGQAIYLKNGAINIGTAEADNPAVLGTETKEFLIALIQWILTHSHMTSAPGAPTSAALQAAQLTQIQTENVDSDKIFSQLIFLLKGGS